MLEHPPVAWHMYKCTASTRTNSCVKLCLEEGAILVVARLLGAQIGEKCVRGTIGTCTALGHA